MKISTIISIGSGGFIGAILRYSINQIPINSNFPFHTLIANLIGSFILGSLFAFFTYTNYFSTHIKSLLSTGMMGALTTYSTFALETYELINKNLYSDALINISLNLMGTITLAGIGFLLFEKILKANK